MAGVFSFDTQRVPSRKDDTRVGDEGKAVGIAQAPAALLSPHNVTIRSVIRITESRFLTLRARKEILCCASLLVTLNGCLITVRLTTGGRSRPLCHDRSRWTPTGLGPGLGVWGLFFLSVRRTRAAESGGRKGSKRDDCHRGNWLVFINRHKGCPQKRP